MENKKFAELWDMCDKAEAGIIVYPAGSVACINWVGMTGYPTVTPVGIVGLPFDLELVEDYCVEDVRQLLPSQPEIEEDENGNKTLTVDYEIITDQYDDIVRLYTDPDADITGHVYKLADGTLIIHPNDWN